MFEIEIVGPCLVWKLKWGGGGEAYLPLPSGYAPVWGEFVDYICLRSQIERYIHLFTQL